MDAIELQIFLKVIIAMALGGIIGIERELARKPAGIRTHMFVAGAAALVITVSQVVIEQFSQLLPAVNADPIRVVEAVIVGISFIGAGTVLKSSTSRTVYYLTTAASILLAAAIGITVAVNLFKLALGITLLVVGINYMVGNIEQHYMREPNDP